MAEDSRGSRTGSGPRAWFRRASTSPGRSLEDAAAGLARHAGLGRSGHVPHVRLPSRAHGNARTATVGAGRRVRRETRCLRPGAQSGPVRPSAARTHPRLLAGGEAPERRREAVAGAGRPQACRCRVARRGAVAAPARAARPRKCSPLPCERRGTFFLGCRGPLARSTSLSHRVEPPRF